MLPARNRGATARFNSKDLPTSAAMALSSCGTCIENEILSQDLSGSTGRAETSPSLVVKSKRHFALLMM